MQSKTMCTRVKNLNARFEPSRKIIDDNSMLVVHVVLAMVATKMNLVLSERNLVEELWLKRSQHGKLHVVNHLRKDGYEWRWI